MTHESLPNPELPSQRFTQFIDSHTDIVQEPDIYDQNVTREAAWTVTDASRLVPIDKVHFKVMVDLGEDKTTYHEIQFTFGDQPVFWVGYDSGEAVFTAVIGENSTDTEVSNDEVVRLLEELTLQEQAGMLRKIS